MRHDDNYGHGEKPMPLPCTTMLVTFAIDLRICMNTQTQLILKLSIVGHVLVGVNPCGRCTIVALLSKFTNLPKKIVK